MVKKNKVMLTYVHMGGVPMYRDNRQIECNVCRSDDVTK